MKKQNVKAFCDDAFSGGSVLDSGMSKRAIDILWPPEFSSDARGESDDRANQFAQMLSRGTHTAHSYAGSPNEPQPRSTHAGEPV